MTKTNASVEDTGQQTATQGAKASSTTPRKPRRRSTFKVVPPIIAVPPVASKVTKRDQLATLVVRDEGATLEQMIAVTGWLPHTTRAALTGLRKAGYVIDSDKIDGVRTYRAVAPQ